MNHDGRPDRSSIDPHRRAATRRRPPGIRARSRSIAKLDRHDDLHRLQGVRGGVPGVERSAAGRRRCRSGTYQTMPDMTSNFWNLIKFNEHDDGARLQLADAQGPVHALRGAGLPHRLPGARRHRPVRQRHRRLPAGQLHRLRVLHDRLPVQRAEVRREDAARLQVHAVRRIACRWGCSRRASRRARPAACSSAPRTTCWRSRTRASSSSRRTGFRRPPSTIRRASAARRSSRCSRSAISRSCTACRANPTVPRAVTFWKGALKTIGNTAMIAGIFGAAASLRSLRAQAQGRDRRRFIAEVHDVNTTVRQGRCDTIF